MKPGKLTPAEFKEMQNHTVFGAKILENAKAELLRSLRGHRLDPSRKMGRVRLSQGFERGKYPAIGAHRGPR